MTKYIIFWLFTPAFLFISLLFSFFWKYTVHILFLILLLATIFPESLDINFLSREEYRSAARGISVQLSDLCTLALFLILILNNASPRILWLPPLFYLLLFYLLSFVLSWIFTPNYHLVNPYYSFGETTIKNEYSISTFETWIYPLFEINRLAKGIFLYWVSFQYFRDDRIKKVFLYSLIVILLILTLWSLELRYIQHINRVSVFSHVNVFNTYIVIIGVLFIPYIYIEKSALEKIFIFFVTVCVLVSIILTISRSSLFAYVLCFVILSLISLLKSHSRINLIIMGFSMLVGILIIFKASDTLYERFFIEEDTKVSYAGRQVIYRLAMQMGLQNIPFGVGVGNFSAFSIAKYEIKDFAAGTLPHNIFYLTFAETGFFGLLAFCMMGIRLSQITFVNIILNFKRKNDSYFAITLGILGSYIALLIQNLFHFSFRHPSVFTIFVLLTAINTAVYHDTIKLKRKPRLDIPK